MRRAAGVLLLVFGGAAAWAQDAPLQGGPLPGTVVSDAEPGRGGAAGGYRMEPGMTAPKIVQAVAAVYPEDLPVVVGTVQCTLSMIVDENGKPLFVHVVHSAGEELDSAAIYAVRQSKFEAGLREQRAVPIRTVVRVSFTQDHAAAVPEVLPPVDPPPAYSPPKDAVIADVPPKLIYRWEPEFSEEARRKKVNGEVVVSFLVTETGVPADVRVVRGVGYGLDEKAMEAVRHYRFKPAMKDGTPIAQHIEVEISFHIR